MDKVQGVPIQLYSRDIPVSLLEDYQLATWMYGTERVWGLTHLGYHTHMCYRIVDSPKKASERRRLCHEKVPDEDWLRWYFDVGARFYCTLHELERCCKEIGIWDSDA